MKNVKLKKKSIKLLLLVCLGDSVNQDASSVVQVDENVIAIQPAKDANILVNRSC